jgi:DNA replication initiation complex subunit (GINS family)
MLSYNDLYEVLRKEKYSEVLQILPKDFVKDFSIYLEEKKNESESSGDLFMDNIAQSKKQLENSISLFKELMRIRKKKMLDLVFVATETGIMKRDYDNMQGFERETFDKLVKSFEENDKEVERTMRGTKKTKDLNKNRLIMFNQDVEQFVNGDGNLIGPFSSGELANLELSVSGVLVQGGKASFVDEE